MKNDFYTPRLIDSILDSYLSAFGAVCIEGPKWCGKTTTGMQHAESIIKLQDTDKSDGYKSTASVKPSLLLNGRNPRLIDEWQEIPILWDAVRNFVDEKNETGLFILTGSNSIDRNNIMHSGTGRISRLRMDTMSLYESGESNGEVSLSDLFDHPSMELEAESELEIEQIIFAACRGGWPGQFSRKTDMAKLQIARDYVSSICNIDISTIDGKERNPLLAQHILRSYARNVSTLAKLSNIQKDISVSFENISNNTLDSYLTAFEKLYVIQDIDAWCPSIRSATAIRSGKKRGFCDPSIAVSALGLSPDYYLNDLQSFGFVFESLCIRDLRVYSSWNEGTVSYYHDRYGLEADCVLHLRDGRYGLFEFKLGSREIDDGSKHLLEMKSLIRRYNETERGPKLREPDILVVLTGGRYAYKRQDGVYVIPVGCLKP